MQHEPETILQYWFGDSVSAPVTDKERRSLWFGGGPEIDDDIRERFAALPPRASRGELDAWREQPRSALALVLVLDQFPRNIYRGSAECFACDSLALEVSVAAIERGFDHELEPVEAVFLYLPFEHSEDIAMQERCLSLFGDLVTRTPQALRERIRGFESYAVRHHRIIERFGRFPHRNAVLKRVPTDEELVYLESGGDAF